jgi:hypothetical protein
MTRQKHIRSAFPMLVMTMAAAIALSDCSSGSSTSPTGTSVAVSGVALSATSMAAGSRGEGTVSLTAAAPSGGATVSLSSSNTSVATVATPITIAAGSSSATFMVTAKVPGTAMITATLGGASRQSPMLTVTNSVAIASIALSASTVVGGDFVTGTVALTTAAPAGGAAVSLSSTDGATVPADVTVPGGSASATFPISTRAVGGTIVSKISGSYGGATASAQLSVTRPTVATARFGVTGPTVTETCTLANNGNTLNCTFDGSTSGAPGTIVAWDWSYAIAAKFTQTTTGPVLASPRVDCSLLPPTLPAGTSWFTMIVTLTIRDELGNVSAEAVNKDVRLLPQGSCGF